MQSAEAIIKKINDKYFLFSKDGKKKLGGPYKTRKEALERLRQVEFFKKQKGSEFLDILVEQTIAKFQKDFNDLLIDEISGETLYDKLSTLAQKIDIPKTGNFLRIRQKDPDQFDEFRIIIIDKSKGIKAVLGIKGKGKDRTSEIQSFLFPKDKFTAKEARKWLKDHKRTSKASVEIEVEGIEFLSPDQVDDEKLAKAGIRKTQDLMFVKFRLCHVGANKNKDEFVLEELQENYDTAVFKPINWEHNKNRIVGTIYDANFISETEAKSFNNKPHIECYAVIYKFLFPTESQIIKDRFEKGTLAFSMETWFGYAECSTCGGTFVNSSDYCEHLKDRVDASSITTRKLRNIIFSGAGIVRNPADIDALGLSVAKKHLNADQIQWMINDIQNFEDMGTILNGFLQKFEDDDLIDKEKLNNKIKNLFSKFISIKDISTTKGGLSVKDTYTKEEANGLIQTAIENYKKDQEDQGKLQKAQDQIAVKEKEIETLKQQLKDSNQNVEKIKKEFDELKANLDKDQKVNERLAELEKDNIKFDENELGDVKANIREMLDKQFVFFKNTLKKKAASETNKKSDNGDNKKLSKASYDLPNLSEATKDKMGKLSSILSDALNRNKENFNKAVANIN